MPTFEKGDMWSIFGKTQRFIITTNPVINSKGAVVMGRGIAKQFADRYPAGPFDMAKNITKDIDLGYEPLFGRIHVYDKQAVYYFMVKRHWREAAHPAVIRDAARELRISAMDRPQERFDLNFPGIGNGKLPREQVLPLLDDLPSNVHIWELE